MKTLLACACGIALSVQCGWSAEPPLAATSTNSESTSSAESPASHFPIALIKLEPKSAEYGTLKDPESDQTDVGPGRIDTTPIRNNNNATWFWPNARKIVTELPREDFAFPAGQEYRSMLTDKFASEGFFHTGVCLWGRTRNMYHWVEYDIPEGATRFTADVLVSDDPLGWFAGRMDAHHQQFTFLVHVDGEKVVHRGETRLKQRQGSGEKLMSVDIPLPPDARTIRFGLEISPWGHGNKNTELIITDGMFRN